MYIFIDKNNIIKNEDLVSELSLRRFYARVSRTSINQDVLSEMSLGI